MKQLFAFTVMLLSASFLFAQDIITLRTGETINGKVAEVGTTEVRYYKSANINGPVYVSVKTDISQIVYENGSKDVFAAAMQQPAAVIVQKSVPQTVYIEKPVRRRNFWNSGLWYPVVTTHIDLGRHGGYYGGHHGRHH